MTRVFGWQADTSGCGWYRIAVPLDELAHRGHTTSYARLMPRHVHGDDPVDVIIGQRVANPGPSGLWQQIAGRPIRPKLVYELDDDLLDVEPANASAHAFFGRPDIRANVLANLRCADAVTVTTPRLAEVVAEHTTAPVHVVPNFIPDSLLDLYRVRSTSDPTGITIGWAGSPSHVADFDEVTGELVRFIRRANKPIATLASPMIATVQQVEFHTIGALFPSMRHIDKLVHTAWVDSVADYYRAIDFTIGLAPLRPSLFNRAKSPIKVMEYAALGVPIIASNTGPYADAITHDVTGLLVDRPHEWGRYLRDLVDDPARRDALAKAAHDWVTDLTVSRNAHLWEQVITNA